MGTKNCVVRLVNAANDFRRAVSMYKELLGRTEFESIPHIDENLSRLQQCLEGIASADATVLRNAIPDLRILNMTNYASGLLGELVRSGIYEADSNIPRVTPRLALFNGLCINLGVSIELGECNFYEDSPGVARQLRSKAKEISERLPEIN